ncbi:hypothetical protein PG991_003900 [Apiospora marii]|uniref:F-box domain-containing protein n=1 Tax=Apiospora marii TaxID=335849 RepID=A0ABR1S4U8_9PEZI
MPVSALDAPHPKKDVTQRNAGSSRLLKLPLEVRLIIYEYATEVDGDIRPRQVTPGSNKFILDLPSKLVVTQLARTCRMIYHDMQAKPVFYRVNHFVFLQRKALHVFLAAITPARRGSIRQITLYEHYHTVSGRRRIGQDGELLPLLQQCSDLRQLFLHEEEIDCFLEWLATMQQSNEFSFLNIPGFKITLDRRLIDLSGRGAFPGINGINDNILKVEIDTDWSPTTLKGNLAEMARQRFGATIMKIGAILSQKPAAVSEATSEQLMNSIAAAGIHFPGEDRVHLNRLGSGIGSVSSRTRQRCNTAMLNASSGTIERATGKYDAEGLLTAQFSIHDIRSVESGIECEISHSGEPKSWEPLHAVVTVSGIRQLQRVYKRKLRRLETGDNQVMESLPRPGDIVHVMDAYINDPGTRGHKLLQEAYRRNWAEIQATYDGLMKYWALRDNEEDPRSKETKTSRPVTRSQRKK